jgi:DNA polymerase elongation subunit (family B)
MNFYTNVEYYRNQMLLRGYDRGKPVREKVNYKPYIFLPTKKQSEYKTLEGYPVEKRIFDSPKDAREFLRMYGEANNVKIYGLTNFLYTFINDEYSGQIEYDEDQIKVVSCDIETRSDQGFPDPNLANQEILSISLHMKGKTIALGLKPYQPQQEHVEYINCENERKLLQKFLTIWMSPEWSPDVVTGWNIDFFDIPYLYNRILNVLGPDDAKWMSPWGIVERREIVRGKTSGTKSGERVDVIYHLYGITCLDYMELYKKFSFGNEESYSLDHISYVVLGDKKVDYKSYGYKNLTDLYDRNFDLFMDYNIQDTVLVDRLEDKLGFIKQVFALAYDAKVNYIDTMTTVRIWDVIIHNYLLDQNIVIPQKSDNEFRDFAGGYVKDPQIGMHNWVLSFDLNSLYPHLIMQYNISPDSFVRKDEHFPHIQSIVDGYAVLDDQYTNTANGCRYRKDKRGFLPELMEKMYNDRVIYKKRMIEAEKEYQLTKNPETAKLISRNHNMQLAKKISLNSAYGALGSRFFRWFDIRHAEAITTSGQLSIQWIIKELNEYLNKICQTKDYDFTLASDTDSLYITLDKLVFLVYPNGGDTKDIVDFLDKVCKEKIEPFINKSYKKLADYMNAYEQKMFMKRENIADKGIWVAKKRYILNVWDKEGIRYENPKVKVVGLETVRSSTPMVVRDALKKAIELIVTTDENTLQSYIQNFKNEFLKMDFTDVAFPRGISGMTKYGDSSSIYKSGTPIQVKGALLYNKYIKDNKLDKSYKLIKDGDKVKFGYLKLPNPFFDTVISMPSDYPEQLMMVVNEFVDRDMQFSKTFIDPLSNILEVINWNLEKTNTLNSFFD